MFKVKICGITNEKDALAAVKFGADALGFIFYKKSPRYIAPAKCAKIAVKINPFVVKTGVFVDEKKETVLKILKQCRLQAVQFHGNETPSYCNFFRKHAIVIKAFNLKDEASLEKIKKYSVDGYLVDTYHPVLKGGSGKVFDLKLACAAARIKRPLILAGGLNAENVISYLNKIKPDAVDVTSGVEKKPGVKDIKQMEKFIREVKNYVTG
ncbi:MAG: phosphoribosylanthranilate isomerase [Candidatus Omnitrophota bacterium]